MERDTRSPPRPREGSRTSGLSRPRAVMHRTVGVGRPRWQGRPGRMAGRPVGRWAAGLSGRTGLLGPPAGLPDQSGRCRVGRACRAGRRPGLPGRTAVRGPSGRWAPGRCAPRVTPRRPHAIPRGSARPAPADAPSRPRAVRGARTGGREPVPGGRGGLPRGGPGRAACDRKGRPSVRADPRTPSTRADPRTRRRGRGSPAEPRCSPARGELPCRGAESGPVIPSSRARVGATGRDNSGRHGG